MTDPHCTECDGNGYHTDDCPVGGTRALLRRALPMLIKFGDFIGNGAVDPNRPGSQGGRCDLILDIKNALKLS